MRQTLADPDAMPIVGGRIVRLRQVHLARRRCSEGLYLVIERRKSCQDPTQSKMRRLEFVKGLCSRLIMISDIWGICSGEADGLCSPTRNLPAISWTPFCANQSRFDHGGGALLHRGDECELRFRAIFVQWRVLKANACW